MKTRCKPGDLAVVVKPGVATGDSDVGIFLTVTKLSVKENGMAVWEFKDASRPLNFLPYGFFNETKKVDIGGGGVAWLVVADHKLRPIRDPGDDAKDEMLRPLPEVEHV